MMGISRRSAGCVTADPNPGGGANGSLDRRHPVHLASRSRELGANDWQVTPAYFSIESKRGSVLDRNVELTLIVSAPGSAAAA